MGLRSSPGSRQRRLCPAREGARQRTVEGCECQPCRARLYRTAAFSISLSTRQSDHRPMLKTVSTYDLFQADEATANILMMLPTFLGASVKSRCAVVATPSHCGRRARGSKDRGAGPANHLPVGTIAVGQSSPLHRSFEAEFMSVVVGQTHLPTMAASQASCIWGSNHACCLWLDKELRASDNARTTSSADIRISRLAAHAFCSTLSLSCGRKGCFRYGKPARTLQNMYSNIADGQKAGPQCAATLVCHDDRMRTLCEQEHAPMRCIAEHFG